MEISTVSESEIVEHNDSESTHSQLIDLPDLKEETLPGESEIPNDGVTEKAEVESGEVSDVILTQEMQNSAAVSSQSTATDVSEQLAVLKDTIISLKTSNDELRQIVNDGLTKVEELEAAYRSTVARNNELDQELARLTASTQHTVSDVALLSTSLTQISARLDKPAEVKATPDSGDGSATAAAGIDISQLLPAIEVRVSELEDKVQHSLTRFGEFASALDHMERDLQRYIRRLSLVVENLSPKEDRSVSDAFLIFVNSVLGLSLIHI